MTDDAEAEADATPDPATNGATETETTTADADGVTEESDGEEPSELAARAAAVDEDIAVEVAALEARLSELEAENEELQSKLARKQADFQNYKKRTKKKQEQLKARATEDLVERLVPVRDNLVRALDQEEGVDIRPGVESTLQELDRVLDGENVTVIEPSPGDEVDPHRHEVMMRVDSDQPEGTVVDRYQPGYEMGDKVLRAAQVTVSTGESADEE
jgi:molecular chaperone GrpE